MPEKLCQDALEVEITDDILREFLTLLVGHKNNYNNLVQLISTNAGNVNNASFGAKRNTM